MANNSECEKLAARFEKMAADGLRDVKFFVSNTDETTADEVCKEVNGLYDAIKRGEESSLDFQDSTHP